MKVNCALCHLRAETDRSRVRIGDVQTDSPEKRQSGSQKDKDTLVSRKHVQLCAQLPIGGRQTTRQRVPLPLDVCQRLGLIWSGYRPDTSCLRGWRRGVGGAG